MIVLLPAVQIKFIAIGRRSSKHSSWDVGASVHVHNNVEMFRFITITILRRQEQEQLFVIAPMPVFWGVVHTHTRQAWLQTANASTQSSLLPPRPHMLVVIPQK